MQFSPGLRWVLSVPFAVRTPAAEGTRAVKGAGCGAGTGLHTEFQPQRVQEREQRLQLHSAFALLDKANEAFGDARQFGQVTLAQPQQAAPIPDLGGKLVRKRDLDGRLPFLKMDPVTGPIQARTCRYSDFSSVEPMSNPEQGEYGTFVPV
ncbi:hypothetical protein SAMN04487915_104276 [Arthrobacter sp. ov118]|nr:hypothetical protein SAMN04487915_104276 [Arthrobacter sp. ov118]